MARVLFVSAPFGAFFRVLANDLKDQGHKVWRIAWDGGDFVETPKQHRVVFRGERTDYERFIRKIVLSCRITAIVTYNDTGDRNRAAIRVAEQMGLSRYILEQGYLRPHWITLDRDGVNGHSSLPKNGAFYREINARPRIPQAFPCRMRSQVLSTIGHFAASIALYPFLPFDTKYYGDSVFMQATGYASEYIWRKTHSEKKIVSQISARKQEGRKIFSIILQKPGDAQLRIHSTYGSNNPFLDEACRSFAAHAPKDAILVVKQHPLDYGVESTPALFQRLVKELNLEGRAYYLRKTSIEIVLDNSDGFVLVNSTAGVAAIQRGLPLKCCGKAIFDMEGLTHQGSLDSFWTTATAPDLTVVNAFIEYLTRFSQINGAVYAPQGIRLASRAICEIISGDLYSPHHSWAGANVHAIPAGIRVMSPSPVYYRS
jgi:capsular polysaccharide export protein